MKYVLVVLLALILGALAYRMVEFNATPAAAPVPAPAGVPQVDTGSAAPRPAPAPNPPPSVAPAVAALPAVGDLLVPVQGILAADLVDTFTDSRSEGRLHDAIDIMAPAGTPVLAVSEGRIEKLFDSERGGLTIYQFDPSGKVAYYYAHLQRYADGLAEQQPVKQGQVLGYVGSTGNANPEGPHLHFAVFVLGPERRWWEGTAVNPYPLLTSKR